MSKQAMIGWIVAVAALAGAETVQAQKPVLEDTARFEYAVKAVCGLSPVAHLPPPLVPGQYYTSINIHNPRSRPVRFQYKVAVTGPNVAQGPIVGFFPASLDGDMALRIDCNRLRQVVPAAFATPIDVFVIIQTPYDLDVRVVYTAGTTGPAGVSLTTMDVECVGPRPTLIPPGASGPVDAQVGMLRGGSCS